MTRDPARSKHFFADAVGLPLSESEGVPDYLTADHSLHGVKHFALWPLSPEGLLVGLTITPWLRDNTGE